MGEGSVLAVLVARGREGGIPKQYRHLANRPLLARTIEYALLPVQPFSPLFPRTSSSFFRPQWPTSHQHWRNI